MKRSGKQTVVFLLAVLTLALLAGCAAEKYTHISQEQARRVMEQGNCLVVDVRTQAEYEQSHIPGAVLVPVGDIRAGKVDALPDKDQILLLYCRTGRRAEDAAALLADMGYTNVCEFGGILFWEGETEP